MEDSGSERWYALRVRSNREKIVQAALRSKNYIEFLPMYRKTSQWSDRSRQVERPLFPGYVFSRFDVNRRLPILMISGVTHIVGSGNVPEPVDEAEFETIKRFVASGFPVEPRPYLREGEPVLVETGPLSGLEGRLLRSKGQDNLIVSLSLLHRCVAVEVRREWLRPIRCFSHAQTLCAASRPTAIRAFAAGGGA
jgi:transcription antitermination factor NusG